MTFKRIDWSPQQLRDFISQSKAPSVSALMALVGDVSGTAHVTPQQTLLVAIELLGLTRTHELVRQDRHVVLSWNALIEDFGWRDSPDPHYHLQGSLLINAIKSVTRKRTPANRLQAQEFVVGLCQVLALDKDLEYRVISHLFLDGNHYDTPWSIWVNTL